MKDLYLNDTKLDNESIKALNKTLAGNDTLQILNLGNCGLDDESLSLLKTGLTLNESLKVIFFIELTTPTFLKNIAILNP